MSTHAAVAAVMNNEIMMTRVNYDGYLDYLGKALLKHFDNLDSISKLMEGEIRAIDLDTGKIEFYEENEYYPQQLNTIFDWYKAMPEEEYNYIFVSGSWFLYSPAKLIRLQDEKEYEAPLLGQAQITSEEILENDKLMKEIHAWQVKSLLRLTQKALAPVNGHVSLGRFDSLHVSIMGNFNLEYDLNHDLWRYPFFDGIGLAYIIYNSALTHYKEIAAAKQCTFKKEDAKTIAFVINLWNRIKSFDRAKNVLFGEDYLHYFLDSLAGLSADYYASEIRQAKKGYVLAKIDRLIASLSAENKKAILQVFAAKAVSEHISVRPVFDYLDNMEKYGIPYKDMIEELEKDDCYVKLRNLRDRAMVMCREFFMDQALKLVKG